MSAGEPLGMVDTVACIQGAGAWIWQSGSARPDVFDEPSCVSRRVFRELGRKQFSWSKSAATFQLSWFRMPAKTDEHTARVNRFCSDLVALQPTEVIRKHITTGMPIFLAEEHYFRLRSLIAAEFDVHPSAVILVGSCRTGFSIAPRKRYKEAKPNSDLDIAVVSQDRFDNYWDSVFAYAAMDTAWRRSLEHKTFVRMLFDGWIDPRGLPNVPRFARAVRWSDFFDALMQSREFGPRRISARLYRTWSRLEAYQEIAVRQCVVNLGVEHA